MSKANLILAVAAMCSVAFLVQPEVQAQVKFNVTPGRTPNLTRMSRAKPSFIPNLAAIRQKGLCLGIGQILGRGRLTTRISGLTQPLVDQVSIPVVAPIRERQQKEKSAHALLSRNRFDCGLFWHDGSADLVVAENCLSMDAGAVVVHTARRTEIDVGDVLLFLQPGTAALVEKQSDNIRVVNLADKESRAAILKLQDRNVILRPGTECFVRSKSTIPSKMFDGCGRRGEQCWTCSVGTLTCSEISIPSLIQTHRLIRMIYENDAKDERRFIAHLLKTTACMVHVQNSAEPFKWTSSSSLASR